MNPFQFFQNKKLPEWTANAVALLGSLFYLIQALRYASTTIAGLDEGSYLYKGILFTRGVYHPFEFYGPLTNKAPLAFLIPGAVEYIFGPGLRTGRYFAIVLGMFIVLGLWIVSRRFGGKWLAAGTVWAFALSPVIVKIHSIAASEVLVACFLTWMCVLTLGENRRVWQIIFGTILAALAILTRQNMVVVLPLLILYIVWQYGVKMGLLSMLAGGLVLLVGHAVYWPNVLVIWAPWLPKDLTPFLDSFRLPKDAVPIWNPSIDFGNRVIAFFQGIRYHFIPVIGSVAALLLWPRIRDWKSRASMRAAVFLSVLYVILFIMHAWAAVASRYESYSCVFCFTPYLTFFDPIGILSLVVAVSSAWNRNPSLAMKMLAFILIPVFSAGIGLSAFENVNDAALSLPVPRMRDGKILEGATTLAEFLINKFSLSLVLVKKYTALSTGLLVAILLLLAAFWIWRRTKERHWSYSFIAINAFLIAGFLTSPFLSAGQSQLDCPNDLIAANEAVGRYLADIIPSNSLVYWDGGLSFTPLLYVSDIRIFPPQINDGYTFRIGGDPDLLYRFSHWNAELNEQWKAKADIFIVEEKRFSGWKNFLTPQDFEEYQRPPVSPSCEKGSGLRIFHRLP